MGVYRTNRHGRKARIVRNDWLYVRALAKLAVIVGIVVIVLWACTAYRPDGGVAACIDSSRIPNCPVTP